MNNELKNWCDRNASDMDAAEYDALEAGDELVFPDIAAAVAGDGVATVENKRTGKAFKVRATLTDRQRRGRPSLFLRFASVHGAFGDPLLFHERVRQPVRLVFMSPSR